jgi:hypothetical protein
MDLLAALQILYALFCLSCGLIILFRNWHYVGNKFFGLGYIIYAIPGFTLFTSHFNTTELFIKFSVKSMLICSAFAIVCLYLGVRTYFKGSFSLNAPLINRSFIGAFLFSLFTIFFPNSVEVITQNPVNSRLNIIIGLFILGWHLFYSIQSIQFLQGIKKSIKLESEKPLKRHLNLIILGFILSIIAILVYSANNFGESQLIDITFFILCCLDVTAIAIGLSGAHPHAGKPI